MIDYRKMIVGALNTVLTTYYALFVDGEEPMPCLTYYESNNYSTGIGDTREVAKVSFYVKVWSTSVSDIATYAPQVDAAMRAIGFRRTSAQELTVDNVICKIMAFEAVSIEDFEEGE